MTVVHLFTSCVHVFPVQDGRTALHHAASGGHLKVCQILVEHGKCDVSVVDNSGQTPFQLAGIGRHKEVVAYLASFDPTKGLFSACDHHVTYTLCAYSTVRSLYTL